MNINPFNKILPKKPLKIRGGTIHRIGRDSYFDWAIMVSIASIITLVLVVIGAYIFINIEDRLSSASTLNTAKKPETINEETLNRIIEQFSARAAERVVLLKGYGGFGDPSL